MELIFVNDASTDNTLDILLQYEQNYPENIMIINCEKNGKQGTARNIGMTYASGDYIGFVDADDWVDSTMYEKLYCKAVELDCDMVGCLCDRVYLEADVKATGNGGQDRKFILRNDEDRKRFLASGIGPHVVCKIYRKSVILENGIYYPEGLIYEDNYWGSLVNYYVESAYLVDEVLYHWYVNSNSTSLERNQKKHFARLTIEELKMEALKERGLYDRFRVHIESEFMQIYYFNSLFVIFTRFDKFPLEIFQRMQKTVKKYIPNYIEVCNYTEHGKILLDLLEVDLSQEELNAVHKMYLEKMV